MGATMAKRRQEAEKKRKEALAKLKNLGTEKPKAENPIKGKKRK